MEKGHRVQYKIIEGDKGWVVQELNNLFQKHWEPWGDPPFLLRPMENTTADPIWMLQAVIRRAKNTPDL